MSKAIHHHGNRDIEQATEEQRESHLGIHVRVLIEWADIFPSLL